MIIMTDGMAVHGTTVIVAMDGAVTPVTLVTDGAVTRIPRAKP